MGKIIAIHSFRGGTGKSNTTASLAVLIAKAGHRVGVIDTDIQSPGIHVIFGRSTSSFAHSLNDYLWGRCRIEEAAYDVSDVLPSGAASEKSRLYLIPSSINTGEIARVLREGYDVGLLNEGFKRLIEALQLDYLLIDTHPGVNEETLLSIAVSDTFLLILRPDNQDFQGTSVTVELARRLDVRRILVVLNKIPPMMDPALLKKEVEHAYAASVVGLLPLNSEIVELASGGVFVTRHPDHPFTLEMRRIATAILS